MQIKPTEEHIAKARISAATTVAPTGVDETIETVIPTSEQTTERHAAKTVTEKNVLNIRIAESAGKTMSAEMRSEPTRFIAITITTATTTAISRLYKSEEIPVAEAKFSSKVTENIR